MYNAAKSKRNYDNFALALCQLQRAVGIFSLFQYEVTPFEAYLIIRNYMQKPSF